MSPSAPIKYPTPLLALVLIGLMTSCNRQPSPEVHAPRLAARQAIAEVDPPEAGRVAAGQTIYVPAYSAIYISDRADRFDLAVTLSIRNTDRAHPIVITAAGYHDQDGQLVRDYLKRPLRVGPMASTEFFVKESDTRGGVSASFLVEWVAEQPVTAPVVESVMVGVASSRGVSFISPGRVVADRNHPGPT